MGRSGFLYYIVTFILYVGLQVIFLKGLSIYGVALCFAYIGFLLTLPVELPTVPLLFIAFALGLSVDIFYDTPGLHAASGLVLAYARRNVLQWVRPPLGYDANTRPTVAENGLGWFLGYASVMVLPHHLLLFLISAANFNHLFSMLIKTLASTVFTVFVVALIQQLKKLYLLSRRRNRR